MWSGLWHWYGREDEGRNLISPTVDVLVVTFLCEERGSLTLTSMSVFLPFQSLSRVEADCDHECPQENGAVDLFSIPLSVGLTQLSNAMRIG